MFAEFAEAGDEEARRQMRKMFGPQQVDQMVRQAIQVCWMCLPEDKRTVDEAERQVRRILDRAIKDMREDTSAFGLDL